MKELKLVDNMLHDLDSLIGEAQHCITILALSLRTEMKNCLVWVARLAKLFFLPDDGA